MKFACIGVYSRFDTHVASLHCLVPSPIGSVITILLIDSGARVMRLSVGSIGFSGFASMSSNVVALKLSKASASWVKTAGSLS